MDSYHLKERLVETEDFVLVPAEAWHKLLSWYGMVDQQPPLERKVTFGTPPCPPPAPPPEISGAMCVTPITLSCALQVVDLPSTLKVEVYPVELFLCLHGNMDNVATAHFSRTDSIREFCLANCLGKTEPWGQLLDGGVLLNTTLLSNFIGGK